MRKPNNPRRNSRRAHGGAPAAGAPAAIFLLLAFVFIALDGGRPALGAVSDYEADFDVSAGTFNYLFNKGDEVPDMGTGVFFSAYLSMKSPLFTFFFNTKNVYSTYEAGVVYNEAVSEDVYLVSIPATVELSYRIPLSRRWSIHPFVGTGLDTVKNPDDGGGKWNLYYLLDGGLEIKYGMWKDTYLKLKVTYGMVFVDSLTSGYAHYIRVRLPVPFIP
jgi:hypothetical protein